MLGERVSFERLADLTSLGFGLVEIQVCASCGALVAGTPSSPIADQQAAHRHWHTLVERGEGSRVGGAQGLAAGPPGQ